MLFRKVHKSWCSLYTLFLKPRHQSTAWPHFTPAPLCPSKLTWPNRKTKNLMLLHEKRFHEASSTKTWLTIIIKSTSLSFLIVHGVCGIPFQNRFTGEEMCIKKSCWHLMKIFISTCWLQNYRHTLRSLITV